MRKAFEPLALVRSPIISTLASCLNGTAWYSDDTPGSGRGRRGTGAVSATASASCRMCSPVVPQHPPTSPTPNSRMKPVSASTSASGPSGYTAPSGPSSGRPAFGITDSGTRACLASCRRCSLISAGPVAQLSPMTSMPSGSSAASAAPTSVPSSIVPVVSTVIEARIGTCRPSAAIARFAPMIDAFVCRMSWVVSTITASAPPASSPRTSSW